MAIERSWKNRADQENFRRDLGDTQRSQGTITCPLFPLSTFSATSEAISTDLTFSSRSWSSTAVSFTFVGNREGLNGFRRQQHLLSSFFHDPEIYRNAEKESNEESKAKTNAGRDKYGTIIGCI